MGKKLNTIEDFKVGDKVRIKRYNKKTARHMMKKYSKDVYALEMDNFLGQKGEVTAIVRPSIEIQVTIKVNPNEYKGDSERSWCWAAQMLEKVED